MPQAMAWRKPPKSTCLWVPWAMSSLPWLTEKLNTFPTEIPSWPGFFKILWEETPRQSWSLQFPQQAITIKKLWVHSDTPVVPNSSRISPSSTKTLKTLFCGSMLTKSRNWRTCWKEKYQRADTSSLVWLCSKCKVRPKSGIYKAKGMESKPNSGRTNYSPNNRGLRWKSSKNRN